MKNKKLKLCAGFIIALGLSSGYSQEATTASGGDASGSGGTVAYSIGQIRYSSVSGSNGNTSEGVQQPYEIFSVGIKEAETNLSLAVFPNPTANYLTLQINDLKTEKLNYQLFDLQGKMIANNQINSKYNKLELKYLK